MITGSSTLSTVTPTISLSAWVLLRARTSCRVDARAAAAASVAVAIVATTRTLAALTASEMASAVTLSEAARPVLKSSWSNVSTVPATVSESFTAG